MSKSTPTAIIDLLLDGIATATRMDVVSDTSTPTDLTGTLANVTIDSGDFTKAAGDVSGRKITIAAQSGVSITGNGTAKHIVLSASGVIKDVTTCTDQVLTSGGTVTFPAWKHEVTAPV